MRVMYHVGSMRVHKLQGGFNEVLVEFMEGLEIKEGSKRLMLFLRRSMRVWEVPGRFLRVQDG